MSDKQGIDISSWQKGIDLSVVPCDFVIIKATQGTTFLSPTFSEQYKQATALKKIVGIYHFADGKSSGKKEADYFLSKIGTKYKKAFLVLDWEADALIKGVKYAKEFLDRVKEKTGQVPLIYMSKSVCRQYDWSSVAKTYDLWVAQYANMTPTGYQKDPWTDKLGYGAWKKPSIFQYSSRGKLKGYSGFLDLNVMYKVPSVNTPTKTESKSIDTLAKEVLRGDWGVGADRKKRLTEAGYDYDKVQKRVNELLRK